MLRLKIILILLIIVQKSFCQSFSISGYVEDSETGERIIGAYVYDSISKTLSQTNNYGFYLLRLIKPEAALRASYVNSKSRLYSFHLQNDTLVNILIKPVKELKEIVISSLAYRRNVNTILSMTTIPTAQLRLIPALGEPDLLKSIQIQTGIVWGVEGSTGLFVRGGGAGENVIMLDDVPIYNASHLYGFFSIFNNSAIKDIKLYKGCFPAKYGGRVSSVVDVRSLDGNNKNFKGELSLGFISSKIIVEGPLFNNKTTYIISGRICNFNSYAGLLKNLNLVSLNLPNYNFNDLNIRFSHTFSLNDKVFFNIYKGKDKIQLDNDDIVSESTFGIITDLRKETSGWGNIIGSLRWNHVISGNLFVNLTAAYSHYNYYVQNQDKNVKQDSLSKETTRFYSSSYASDINDFIIKTDFEYGISNNLKLTFGLGNTFHKFSPGRNEFFFSDSETNLRTDTSISNPSIRDNEPFIYVGSDLALSGRLFIVPGLRLSALAYPGKSFLFLEPRLALNYKILPELVIKCGYSKMVQYLHLLSVSGLSMPTDLWIPALKGLLPERSDQLNIGASYELNKNLLFTLEAYHKWSNNTTDFKNGAYLLSDILPWYELTTQGKGKSQGIEFSAEKQEGKLTGSINYTLAYADRRYSELNNGIKYPFRYDRRHSFNIQVNYEYSDKWDISATWVFGTGYPVTLPVEKYLPALNLVNSTIQQNYTYYYPSLYNFRMTNYLRFDLGIHYKSSNRLFQHLFSFDIYNAFNYKNAVNVYFMQNYSFRSIYMLPIIPSFTYTLKFNGISKNSS